MDIEEVVLLTAYLHELYGEKFPKLSPAMTKIWYEDLHRMDNALMEQTVNRWARQHTLKSPSLDELLEQAEFLQEEQRRHRPPSTRDKSVADILAEAITAGEASQERSEEQATFGKLMIQLMRRATDRWMDAQGVWHDKLTLQERAEQCYALAKAHPALREQLEYQARSYADKFWTEEQRKPLPPYEETA